MKIVKVIVEENGLNVQDHLGNFGFAAFPVIATPSGYTYTKRLGDLTEEDIREAVSSAKKDLVNTKDKSEKRQVYIGKLTEFAMSVAQE